MKTVIFGVCLVSAFWCCLGPARTDGRAEEAIVEGAVVASGHSAGDAASSAIVVNGGFEHRTVGVGPAYIQPLDSSASDLVGWQVTVGSVDWIGPERWRAAEGKLCIDIDAPGGIQQTIQTVPGVEYLLQFDMAGNPETEPAAKRLAVTIDDQRCEFDFDATGHATSDLGWTKKQVLFRAVGPRTVLTFVNAAGSATASGVALDNVSVEPVMVLAERPKGATDRFQLAMHNFQLATHNGRLILVDTRSGDAWVLIEQENGLTWRAIERLDAHGLPLKSGL